MSNFTLHQRLDKDCIELGLLQNSILLLMNNSLVPWFIIVPKTMKQEVYNLSEEEQRELYTNINKLSEYIMTIHQVDKLNVASIGNVVNQMHIHVVGRRHGDYCWPDVVWGKTERQDYNKDEIKTIVQQLQSHLEGDFTARNF